MSFLLSLPRPSSAWSQEVLHNATQDLVKVFICVFTNISAAGFKPHRGKDSTLMLMFMFRSSINHVIILTFLSPLCLSCPSSRSSLGKMRATSPSPLRPRLLPHLRLSPRPPPGSRTPPCPARARPACSTASWRRCKGWGVLLLWPP